MKKIIITLAIFTLGATLLGCQSPEGIKISDCYYQVGEHVEYWRKWRDPQFKTNHITKTELKNSDAKTFETINHPFSTTCYAKDQKQVYTTRLTIKEADPDTFEFLGEFYARDKNFVFNGHKKINKADRETFIVLYLESPESSWIKYRKGFIDTVADAKDKNYIYNNGKLITRYTDMPDVATFEFISSFYFKDKNHIYRVINGNAPIDDDLMILEADYDTFEITDEKGFYARDKNQGYKNIRGKNFKIIERDEVEIYKKSSEITH